MFKKARNLSIRGGTFNVTSSGLKGINLLQKCIAPGAFHNSAERYDPPKCHPGTRIAVIEAIMSWIQDGQKTSFIMWLYGPAGAGKSAIAQNIAELCHQLGILSASFFWSRTAGGRNDEKRLIATMAYQLILLIPQMCIHVEQALEHDPALLSRCLQTQMDSLIVEPLNKAFHHRSQEGTGYSNVIVLDGLDECGTSDTQQYILKVISTAVQSCPVPLVFLIASRPEHGIRDSFNTAPVISITARLALDDNYLPDDDIRLFLAESFASLKRTHTLGSCLPLAWPTAKDVEQIVQKSSGQFIYAATVLKFVQSPRHRPDQRLEIILGISEPGEHTPFAELDTLYRYIFSTVEDLPRVLDILSCCILVKNQYPFTHSAKRIEKLLGYQSGDLQLLLIDLHSVLDVPDSKRKELRILHASLQDFLMDPSRSRNFYLDTGKAYARLVRAMVQYYHDRHSYPQGPDYDHYFDKFNTDNLPSHRSKL